jgi:myo-inositol-1-phosphate synthase
MSKVRLAIVGVGNCASSLVQGLEYYKDANPDERVPGLMHVDLGGYHVGDIEVVAAFDVDAKKVGTDVAEAIFSEPNNTIRFAADVPPTGVMVQRGHTLDSLGTYYRETIVESEHDPVDVAQVLRDAQADVLVSYLPVGSEQAARYYAQAAIDAGVGFVNCLPVFIASEVEWAKKFGDAGLPIIGDDIKSQVGATITHRVLTKLFEDRGVKLNRTYQLNFGGNMDFMNMLERKRLKSKKISKTQSVQSQLRRELDKNNIHIGPSDYVPWLEDRKWADPPGGSVLRRRAADHRDEARGLGQPELGRHRDRRRALREARARPQDRRSADRPLGLLHEVAAGPVQRRRRARWSRSSSRAWARRPPPTGPRSSTSARNACRTPTTPDGSRLRPVVQPQRRRGPRRPHAWCSSGPAPLDRDGALVGAGDMAAQSQVFENLRMRPGGRGATFADVVKMGTFVTRSTTGRGSHGPSGVPGNGAARQHARAGARARPARGHDRGRRHRSRARAVSPALPGPPAPQALRCPPWRRGARSSARVARSAVPTSGVCSWCGWPASSRTGSSRSR